jgi:hypothetical protein
MTEGLKSPGQAISQKSESKSSGTEENKEETKDDYQPMKYPDASPDKILPEPNLGDIGCIEDAEELYETLEEAYDELAAAEAELNICNAELVDLIVTNSVKLTEQQMREAEGAYQMIGEEEKSSQKLEALVKEQAVTDSRDLKVKLGVAKEEKKATPIVDVQHSPVKVSKGDEEVEPHNDEDTA